MIIQQKCPICEGRETEYFTTEDELEKFVFDLYKIAAVKDAEDIKKEKRNGNRN